MRPPTLPTSSSHRPRRVMLLLLAVALCGTCATEGNGRQPRETIVLEPIVLEPIVLDTRSPPAEPPYSIDSRDNGPTPLAVRIEPVGDDVSPGRAAAFTLRLEGSTTGFSQLAAALGGRRAMVVPVDDERQHVMLVAPVHLEERRSTLTLEVDGELSDGTLVALSRSFEVKPVRYGRRALQVGSKFLGTSRARARPPRIDGLALRAALSTAIEELPWEGSFLHPTNSAETAAFGTRRLLNGVHVSRHMGWDLDGRIGDPVWATQSGRVVVSARLFHSGGTVILDHGQRLFSLYFHLSTLDVRKGDAVQRAQQIGRIGRSGRVTGPHLHFALKLDGVYVDPERWLALPWAEDVDEAAAVDPLHEKAVRVTGGAPSSARRATALTQGTQRRGEPS